MFIISQTITKKDDVNDEFLNSIASNPLAIISLGQQRSFS